MSKGLAEEWTPALENQFGITTAMLLWFDFQSGSVGCWTGTDPIIPSASGDGVLDGKQFDPIGNGVVAQVGDISDSYQGSEALSISILIPDSPAEYMVDIAVDPEEYQGRTAIIWRAIMIAAPTPGAPAAWAFRRVRAGSMDELSITNDGQNHIFNLTIEAHASMITKATGSTYLDQKRFDPTDISNDFAVSIANNPDGPSKTKAVSNSNSIYTSIRNRLGQ